MFMLIPEVLKISFEFSREGLIKCGIVSYQSSAKSRGRKNMKEHDFYVSFRSQNNFLLGKVLQNTFGDEENNFLSF